MKYTDILYGEVNILENVIVDIINTKDFQRLEGIDQAGYFEVYFPGTKHSRFEHSLGCYLLLEKFNASIEERIAGLIHDMSHSAFSHVADYVFEGGRGADHNYQDDIFKDFILQTDVPKILKRYGFDVNYILDESNFPLQETKLPDICADRIDYSLRGAIIFKIINKKTANDILNHLKILNEKWVFDNFEYAKKYAQIFKKLNDVYYSNKETAAMFLRTSNWIKYAIDKKYITFDELYTTDDKVIKKINKHINKDDKLRELWKIMNNSKIALGTKKDINTIKVVVKSRIVDPLFIQGDDIKRISDYDCDWNNILKKEIQPKTYYLK